MASVLFGLPVSGLLGGLNIYLPWTCGPEVDAVDKALVDVVSFLKHALQMLYELLADLDINHLPTASPI